MAMKALAGFHHQMLFCLLDKNAGDNILETL